MSDDMLSYYALEHDDVYDRILSFLDVELARKEGHPCVAVELLWLPDTHYIGLRTWARDAMPELFEDAPAFAAQIFKTADNKIHASRVLAQRRFGVLTRAFTGAARKPLSFSMTPSEELIASLPGEECVAIDLLLSRDGDALDDRLSALVPAEGRRRYLRLLADQLRAHEKEASA